MANLALNVTIKWKVLIALLSVTVLAVLCVYSSLWKRWWTDSEGIGNIMHTPDENIQEGYISWNGINNGVFRRQIAADNSKFEVLLLHGARFTSKTWQDIGTLQALSSEGYTVIAVDLPQHGASMSVQQPKDDQEKVQFLADVMDKLNLKRPVLVAPSMSGSYAMPFVLDKKHSKELRGFIPIAPGAVAAYSESDLKGVELATLIVYGEKDQGFQQYVGKMKEIPGSEVFIMKDASHPCYLDNPKEFHKRVLEFLRKLD